LIDTCFCPRTVEEAVAVLHEKKEDVRVVAGGTDLFVMMRKGKSPCRYLLDISGLGLDRIWKDADSAIHIGASVTLTQAQYDPLFSGNRFECFREACGHVGSLQIRNAATVVGNICTGITSADVAIPLLVLDAKVRAVSAAGERIIPITEFFEAPRKLAIGPEELITEIIIEPMTDDAAIRSRFRKVGPRKELIISIFSIAVLARMTEGTADAVRIAMGVVSPVPMRLGKTEAYLAGKEWTPDVINESLRIMQTEISPRTSLHGSEEYRRLLANNLLKKYLQEIEASRKGGDER